MSNTKSKKASPWIVFIAIILGVIIGSLTPQTSFVWEIYNVGGRLFINALLLLVVPLVASSIITGVAKIAGDPAFGRLGLKTFGAFLGTNLLAILTGALFVNLLNPGAHFHAQIITDTSAIQQMAAQNTLSISHLLLQIIPSNIIDAFSKGQMLGIIFFSILFGYCISKISKASADSLNQFAQGVFETMLQFTHLIMKTLPLGVFLLVAKVFSEFGLQSLQSLGLFTLTVLLGFIFFMFVVLPILLKFIAGKSPIAHIKAMTPALITAFSTSSSAATLPVTMECVEKRAGVSNKISSLVIPLGTSMNLTGSALYMCVASLFVAQAYGIDLTLTTQALIVLLAFMLTLGVAGVPSSSLVAIIAILHAIGIPAEGIGLFIAVDRVLDMCRTTVSVFTGSCCAVLVDS
ncbi:MAG: dicarboxylate/amino acid:cation symporter [Legionellales bacterium]|jgi:Na+/H+-dicarboxylate symporter